MMYIPLYLMDDVHAIISNGVMDDVHIIISNG